MDNKPERIVIIGVLLLLLLLKPILWQITNDKNPPHQPKKPTSGIHLAFIEMRNRRIGPLTLRHGHIMKKFVYSVAARNTNTQEQYTLNQR